MRNLSEDKVNKELSDFQMHRACVMRSGRYLCRYLSYHNRSVDAIRLLGRCYIHDISKIQNTEEFLSLASIVDEMDSMHDVSHVLSPSQTEAIKLHWKHNSHHPEHYENPNDMSDLDLMEMACDCHARSKQYGTDLLEFIKKQQDLRFHFNSRKYGTLLRYCIALVELAKDDDYSAVLNENYDIGFDLKDVSMRRLEAFDESAYVESAKTDRLYLNKEDTADFATTAYSINTSEDHKKIGYISVKFNGQFEFRIFEEFKGNGYAAEALSKFMEIAQTDNLFIVIRSEDKETITMLADLGFAVVDFNSEQTVLRYKKEIMELKKVPTL